MSKVPKRYPFFVEPHPDNYNGYHPLSIIEFDDVSFLPSGEKTDFGIIDNIFLAVNAKDWRRVRYLSISEVERVNMDACLLILNQWDENIPLSVFCDKIGISPIIRHAWRVVNTQHIVRIIGPVYYFDVGQNTTTKRRKVKRSEKSRPTFQGHW